MSLVSSVPTLVCIECDKPNCGDVIRPVRDNMRTYGREVDAFIEDWGWSVWVGRSRRYYCPDHGPARPETMHKVSS